MFGTRVNRTPSWLATSIRRRQVRLARDDAVLLPAGGFFPTASANPVLVASRWLTLCNALNYNVDNFVKFVTNLLPVALEGAARGMR